MSSHCIVPGYNKSCSSYHNRRLSNSHCQVLECLISLMDTNQVTNLSGHGKMSADMLFPNALLTYLTEHLEVLLALEPSLLK